MKIPDPLKRRHLVEQALDAKQALAIADAYLTENRVVEALEFLSKAEAHDRLRELRQQALDSGDVFLVRDLSNRLGEELNAADWRAVAAAAEAAGKETYAIEARRLADART
jgi:hypothetical protein